MSAQMLPLNQIVEGQEARVHKLLVQGSLRRRFLDLGLIEGTTVVCLQKSPAGDPIAYGIRGAVIALRSSDSRHILVNPLPLE